MSCPFFKVSSRDAKSPPYGGGGEKVWAGEMGGNLLDLLTKHFLAFLVQMFNMHANESILYVSYPVRKTLIQY